ncbi:MAG TPA: hypothetical protein VF831_05115, partial [Anaerolineales bacterium]
TPAFWVASLLILLGGLLASWKAKHRIQINLHDLREWPLLLGLVGIALLFTLILRGQSIFDEYLHLPLISIMAAGDIPPHFYLNPAFNFAYHYGIQVFSASLVRLAGFFPWSAWDLSRALAIGFTLALGWLWVRKVTRSRLAAWLGTFLFTFGGGTRWLLTLLPASWLGWVSRSVNLVGTGLSTAPNLAQALTRPWVIEGGGPVPFPFAYHNGIFVPVFFTLGSTGAMPFMTVLLLLLLLPTASFTPLGLLSWSLIFTTLALSAEHLFAVIWVGIALAMLLFIIRQHESNVSSRDGLRQWGIILGVSLLLALLQGGFITETARNLFTSMAGGVSQSINARGFSLRWPPGLLSAHLGSLSITNPGQLVALLAELGPALLLVPVIFWRFRKHLLQRHWFTAGLAISVVLSLVIPLFFQYEVDRSITRMPATALWTSLVLAFPILWMLFSHAKWPARTGVALGYLVIVLAGVVIFRIQLYSISTPQYAYYIDGLDAGYTADYWDKLPPGSQVLDRIAERSVTVFGRITRASSGIYDPLPDWQALVADPEPGKVAAAGYDYIYMDRIWWEGLSAAQQTSFKQPCIDIIDSREQDNKTNYRLLLDVSPCK